MAQKKAKKKDTGSKADDLLAVAVAEIEKKWGPGSVHVPGEEPVVDKPVIPTGIKPLDNILGNGGIATGTIVEIFGEEGSGKSTLCLQMIAQAQKRGLNTLFIDMEQALKVDYAKKVGADVEKMYISQPSSMEMALSIVESMVRTGEIGLVIIDSLASLVPQAELDKTIEENTMGIQAKKMSEWLRRFNPVIAKTGAIVIFTNQLREKIGIMFGNPKTTPGGKALRFYASYRLEVKILKKIHGRDGEVVGNQVQITTVKNKLFSPYKSVVVNLKFGEGIDVLDALLNECVAEGLIIRSGNWFKFSDISISEDSFNGTSQILDFMRSNENVVEELESRLESKGGENEEENRED